MQKISINYVRGMLLRNLYLIEKGRGLEYINFCFLRDQYISIGIYFICLYDKIKIFIIIYCDRNYWIINYEMK